jgi:hypothetical protein
MKTILSQYVKGVEFMEYRIETPLKRDIIRKMKAGDSVYINGTIYTARDAAHKRMIDIIKDGGVLPFDIREQIIYYVGPCPASPGKVIGSVSVPPNNSSGILGDLRKPPEYDSPHVVILKTLPKVFPIMKNNSFASVKQLCNINHLNIPTTGGYQLNKFRESHIYRFCCINNSFTF